MITPSTQQQASQSLAQAPAPQADLDRKREMQEAWKAYRGKLPDPLVIERRERNHNIKPNRCATVVNKGVSFLFGQVLKIEVKDKACQEFLDGFWGDDDDKMTELAELAMNGGVCGQVFAKLIPAKDGMKYPRLVNLDPQNIRTVTDPEDSGTILAYVIEYPIHNDIQKRQIIARVDPDSSIELWGNNDPNDVWTITNYQRRGQATQQADWQQIGGVEDWLYPFAPVFTCKNLPNPNEPWGMSDLTEDLIAMNKAINFMASNIAKIVYWHAHRILWAKGVRAGQISTSADEIVCLESPDAELGELPPMENFDGLLKVLADLRSDMDEQSRVPAVALGRIAEMIRGTVSGVALELMFQPLLEKTTQKRRLYGRLIREISRAALVLGGLLPIEQYADYKVELRWQPLLPNDNLQAAQEALILQQLEVSMSTIFAGLGLDYDSEAEKKTKELAKQVSAYAKGQGLPPAPPAQPALGVPGQTPTQPESDIEAQGKAEAA